MKTLIHETECAACKDRRRQRHHVLTTLFEIPKELHEPPYTEAPAMYSFNVARYCSMQLRSRGYTRRNRQQLSGCCSNDVPLHPADRDLNAKKLTAKLTSWLSRHDRGARHFPGLLGLTVGMPMRLTDTDDQKRQLYRGRRWFMRGWALHPGCIPEDLDGEWLLDRLPLVIYLCFPQSSWQMRQLKLGISPSTPKSRTWKHPS